MTNIVSRGNTTPWVATYADHEVITPPNKLLKALAAVTMTIQWSALRRR